MPPPPRLILNTALEGCMVSLTMNHELIDSESIFVGRRECVMSQWRTFDNIVVYTLLLRPYL